MSLHVGHYPWLNSDEVDVAGIDVLATVNDDGTIDVALRPGEGLRGWTWGPPLTLTTEVAADA